MKQHRQHGNRFLQTLIILLVMVGQFGILADWASADDVATLIITAPTSKKSTKQFQPVGGTLSDITSTIQVKAGQKLKVKVQNVNGLLYDVKIDAIFYEAGDWTHLTAANNPFHPNGGGAATGAAAIFLQVYDLYSFATRAQAIIVQNEQEFVNSDTPDAQDIRLKKLQTSVLVLARTVTRAAAESPVSAQDILDTWNKVKDTSKWVAVDQASIKTADQQAFYDSFYKTPNGDAVAKIVQKGAHLLAAVGALSLETSKDFDVPATAPGGKITITITARDKMAIPAQKPDFPNDELGEDLDKTKLGKPTPTTIDVATDANQGPFSYAVFFYGVHDQSYVVNNGRIARRGAEDSLGVSAGVIYHFPITSIDRGLLAPSIGIATNGSALQYFLGMSLRLSQAKSKTAAYLTGGIAAAQVKRLDGVEIGDTTNQTVVPTKSVYRTTWFLGLSIRF